MANMFGESPLSSEVLDLLVTNLKTHTAQFGIIDIIRGSKKNEIIFIALDEGKIKRMGFRVMQNDLYVILTSRSGRRRRFLKSMLLEEIGTELVAQ